MPNYADDIIFIVAVEEEHVTSYSPVAKAESFMCTTCVNSTKFSTEPQKRTPVVTPLPLAKMDPSTFMDLQNNRYP